MRRWIISLIKVLTILILFAIIACAFLYKNIFDYVEAPINITQPRELWVESGASLNGTLLKLQRQKVIKDIWKIKAFVKLNPQLMSIKKGVYQLDVTDTPKSLLSKLHKGSVKNYSVSLIEGHTVKQWLNTLNKQPRLKVSEDAFLNVLLEQGDDTGLPEGKFYPDTYHYTSSTSVNEILTQSYLKMNVELNKSWRNRAKNIPLKSAYELLILASIIEKETGKSEEREIISAVFNNRLRKKMRLQTDPTVIYGMGDRFNGNIRKKDLRERTAFNTYRINGLPPTPIAAPSIASIKAAAHPSDVSFLYFVSKNDGSHVFSTTLKEHNRAVNKYQRNKK
ncbi:endolytic transglycosylase MltG [Parashewanella spongiae]|uniref:Endolytic murein transglycosylase n=1 Tax=Parashewanella spongiae TaxID=342950 RepID=A0A3A6TZB0_9GAMM|nr:endolytic transglycosylase MltG [Parashewanella spongiae]MCL1077349.1 endolytic transglycosylase MltG [Parashewanella spongiae]RJY18316.1 endolytic transglycosylase MltG [Parashewanella spongiae]